MTRGLSNEPAKEVQVSKVDSSKRARLRKPSKDFPLGIHQGTGYWQKKVRGRVFYFGSVADDPKGVKALDEWLRVRDDLMAGREPRDNTDGLTVAKLCNKFLGLKSGARDNGELSPRMWGSYYRTCAVLVKFFGKGRTVDSIVPDDFRKLRARLAKGAAPTTLKNDITRCQSVFKFAHDDGLILHPIRFGRSFDKPSNDVLRRDRQAKAAEHGLRMFEADELRTVLNNAEQPIKAMVAMGINCGYGNNDCASLPTRAVDFKTGWVDFGRPKTGVPRRVKLWPETLELLKEAREIRPKAKHAADSKLMFLTATGLRWVRSGKGGCCVDPLGKQFAILLRDLGLKRPGLAFYAIRHTFETIAGGCRDQVAVNHCMGHTDNSMAGVYRERIDDERLVAVTNHVHDWLYGKAKPR